MVTQVLPLCVGEHTLVSGFKSTGEDVSLLCCSAKRKGNNWSMHLKALRHFQLAVKQMLKREKVKGARSEETCTVHSCCTYIYKSKRGYICNTVRLSMFSTVMTASQRREWLECRGLSGIWQVEETEGPVKQCGGKRKKKPKITSKLIYSNALL